MLFELRILTHWKHGILFNRGFASRPNPGMFRREDRRIEMDHSPHLALSESFGSSRFESARKETKADSRNISGKLSNSIVPSSQRNFTPGRAKDSSAKQFKQNGSKPKPKVGTIRQLKDYAKAESLPNWKLKMNLRRLKEKLQEEGDKRRRARSRDEEKEWKAVWKSNSNEK